MLPPPIVIHDPKPEDIFMAFAGIQTAWLIRYEHRYRNGQLRIWPMTDWQTGPAEFVKWLTEHKDANAKSV